MYTIRFEFEQEGIAPVMLQDIEAGQTLLEIALGNDIELHHNCGGVCSCTTCHLYIRKGLQFIDESSRREKDFLSRVINVKPNSRLGCQSLLLEGSGDMEIVVPDQRLLPDGFWGWE